MSDYIIKIVPKDPFCKLSQYALAQAKSFLESRISCDSVQAKQSDMPEFIDCGSDLEQIECPECGAELAFDWWSQAMDAAGEAKFASLETKLPCCEKTASLNDLKYHFPCAFACCAIELWNPDREIGAADLACVQRLLRTEIRIIKAHI